MSLDEWTTEDFRRPTSKWSQPVPSDPWRQPTSRHFLYQRQLGIEPARDGRAAQLRPGAATGGGVSRSDCQLCLVKDTEEEIWTKELRNRETHIAPAVPRSRLASAALFPPSWAAVHDFDPTARRPQWRHCAPEPPTRVLARRKAARLVTALELPKVASHHAALAWLTDLFEEQASPATFSTILREVLKGADLEQIQQMVALRDVWAQTPEWWAMRRFCQLRRRFVFTRARTGGATLSWALAARVAAARDMYPPELMIDPNWYTEWMTLERHHSFGTFARYVAWRIDRRWLDHECFAPDEATELIEDCGGRIQRIAQRAQSLVDLLDEHPQQQMVAQHHDSRGLPGSC